MRFVNFAKGRVSFAIHFRLTYPVAPRASVESTNGHGLLFDKYTLKTVEKMLELSSAGLCLVLAKTTVLMNVVLKM